MFKAFIAYPISILPNMKTSEAFRKLLPKEDTQAYKII